MDTTDTEAQRALELLNSVFPPHEYAKQPVNFQNSRIVKHPVSSKLYLGISYNIEIDCCIGCVLRGEDDCDTGMCHGLARVMEPTVEAVEQYIAAKVAAKLEA